MYKMTISVPGGTMEVPGDSLEAVIKAASFLQNLPFVCPVDGTPTRLNYRKAGGFDYYGLVSTGSPVYTYPFGRPLEKGDGEFFEGKFVKQGKEGETRRQWCYYDHGKQEQIVVWEDGKLLVKVPQGGRPNGQEAIAQHDEVVTLVAGAMRGEGTSDMDVSPAQAALTELRKDYDKLGTFLYGKAWAATNKRDVLALSENKTDDSNELSAADLRRAYERLKVIEARRVKAVGV